MADENRLRGWTLFWGVAPFVALISTAFVGMYLSFPVAFVMMILLMIPCYHAMKFWMAKICGHSFIKGASAGQGIIIATYYLEDTVAFIPIESSRDDVIQLEIPPPRYEEGAADEEALLQNPSLQV